MTPSMTVLILLAMATRLDALSPSSLSNALASFVVSRHPPTSTSSTRGMTHDPSSRTATVVVASRIIGANVELSMTSSFFADATSSSSSSSSILGADGGGGMVPTTSGAVQVDSNGVTFEVGCTVAISSSSSSSIGGIPAYSVPKSCHGTFDSSTGKFVPLDESSLTSSRVARCLLLPPGLRGRVVRVYDTNEWDRARPIVGGGGGGYDVPRSFVMHFDADELVVVP
ncbi:hypothetical protein ACHAXA_000614 [Cyclostephanos tholiformis]|uniref:Uncharacterized protein n=1 Tax=Cyclostephanos tholiformis TaxID=382380 RepID=A0ABD3SR85_9STRA